MANKIVGIYQITCVKNGKRYIGQSKDIRCRFNQHKCKPPARMVEDFERYGKKAFKFEVIEECAPEELDKKETTFCRFTRSIIHGRRLSLGILYGLND